MNINPRKKNILIAGACLGISGLLLCSTYQENPDAQISEPQSVSLRASVTDVSIEDILKSGNNRKPAEPVRDELVRGAVTGPVASDGDKRQDDPHDIERVQALIREAENNMDAGLADIEHERRGSRVDEAAQPSASEPVAVAQHKEVVKEPTATEVEKEKTSIEAEEEKTDPEEENDTLPESVPPVKVSPFNSIRLAKGSTKNAIKAYVHSEQVVMEGSTLKLRLGEKAYTDNGVLIPRNSPVYGVVTGIDGERVQVRITSINVNGNILPFAKNVYSKDALLGIYVPGNPKADASKEVTAGALDGLPTTGLAGVDAATRIAGVVASSAANAGKQVLSQNIKKIKVTIKTNYEVYLRPDTK